MVYDPIDRSKSNNINSSLPVETIFAIYKRPDHVQPDDDGGYAMDVFQQRGTNMVMDGHCMYSAMTMLVLTIHNGARQSRVSSPRRIPTCAY